MIPAITPEWVESIPERLEPGMLYVSIRFATATHLCACGCRSEVVTPLAPRSWKLTYDGTVSLHPSIGNWSFPCRSHYWIRSNRVIRAAAWTDAEVAEARERAGAPDEAPVSGPVLDRQ